MKISEAGFRGLYHRFIVIEIDEWQRETLDIFPGFKEANCVLAYGYLDSSAGVSFEVLEVGKKSTNGLVFSGGRDDVSYKFRFDAVEDHQFTCPDETNLLREKHKHKIESIHRFYAADDGVEQSRSMTILDGFRYEQCPDDVLVILLKKDVNPEKCWITITGMEGKHFRGKLLNEPFAGFGVHNGDVVEFDIGKDQSGKTLLYSLLN